MYLVTPGLRSWGHKPKYPKTVSSNFFQIFILVWHNSNASFGMFRWGAFQCICSGQPFLWNTSKRAKKWPKIFFSGFETPRNELSTPKNPYFDPWTIKIHQAVQKLWLFKVKGKGARKRLRTQGSRNTKTTLISVLATRIQWNFVLRHFLVWGIHFWP